MIQNDALFIIAITFAYCQPTFIARCTIVQGAVLRSHVVRPSVTLVDQDHIGWKSWKPIARTLSPTPSLFGSISEMRKDRGKVTIMEGL